MRPMRFLKKIQGLIKNVMQLMLESFILITFGIVEHA